MSLLGELNSFFLCSLFVVSFSIFLPLLFYSQSKNIILPRIFEANSILRFFFFFLFFLTAKIKNVCYLVLNRNEKKKCEKKNKRCNEYNVKSLSYGFNYGDEDDEFEKKKFPLEWYLRIINSGN